MPMLVIEISYLRGGLRNMRELFCGGRAMLRSEMLTIERI